MWIYKKKMLLIIGDKECWVIPCQLNQRSPAQFFDFAKKKIWRKIKFRAKLQGGKNDMALIAKSKI